jgi:hypothetical protein
MVTGIAVPSAKNYSRLLEEAERGEKWALEELERLRPALEEFHRRWEKYEEANDQRTG